MGPELFMTKPPPRPLHVHLLNVLVRLAPVTRKHHHNSILMRKTLDGLDVVEAPAGHELRLATAADRDAIAAHAEALPGEVYGRRLRRGDRCYCLCAGREVLSYNWVAATQCCVHCGFEEGMDFLPLRVGQAFTYDFYTYRSRRREGLGRMMKHLLLRELAREGVREVLSLVQPSNTASLAIHLGAGYEPVCLVYGYRLRGWTRTYFERPERRPGLDAWMRDLDGAPRS